MSTSLADWKGVPAPTVQTIEGRFIRLEKLDPARHGEGLFKALQGPGPIRSSGTIYLMGLSRNAVHSTTG